MRKASDESTSASLLALMHDAQDTAAWQRFIGTYRPLIEDWCRKCGLPDADRDDVAGMVLLKVAERMQRGYVYDPGRSFRGWLWAVVVSQANELKAAKYGQPARGSGDSRVQQALEQHPAPPGADGLERDLEALVRQAADRVKARLGPDAPKWQSFWRTAVLKQPGKEVAARLGMSVAAVHQNKSRVARLIREEVARLRDAAGTFPGGGYGIPSNDADAAALPE
jgi:DNA-directed RNA polymerase specialized sigma24 family protein